MAKTILTESLSHHRIGVREVHPHAKHMVVSNILRQLVDKATNEINISGIHDLLRTLCSVLEQDGRLLK